MAGLLGGFDPLAGLLGPAQNTDPLAAYLGVDPAKARLSAIGDVAGGLSDALLYRGPRRNSGGIAGAIGQLGSGFAAGGTAAVKGQQERLATDLLKKQALTKMQDEDYARQREKEQDAAWTSFAASLPEDQRKMVQNNPALAQELGKQWAQAQYPTGSSSLPTGAIQKYNLAVSQGFKGTFEEWQAAHPESASGSSNHYGAGQPGVGEYAGYWIQPDLAGGPPKISKLPEDVLTSLSPELKKLQAEATAGGTVTGKNKAEIYWDDLNFAQGIAPKIQAMDTAVAGADKFAGISYDKFIAAGGNPQAWYDWSTSLDSVKATATAAVLDEAKLYPMSEGDRDFVRAMATGGLDQWNSPEKVKRLIGVLRKSSIKRLGRIKEGKSATMPDVDALIKQFETPAEVTPPPPKEEEGGHWEVINGNAVFVPAAGGQ